MGITYSENPDNFNEIEAFVETDIGTIRNLFYSAEKIAFYDACSFQRHSHLAEREKSILVNFYKEHGAIIFITRCVMMELASYRHILADESINFIKRLSDGGVKVVMIMEPNGIRIVF